MSDGHLLPAFAGYGIELEYMIVDRDTLDVLPIADRLLSRLDAHDAGSAANFAWSNELVLHLLELKNVRPDAGLEDVAAGLQAEARRVGRLLESMNAALMPTGMHPWMEPRRETRLWPDASGGIYSTYARIFDCATHGWANLQSTQINLPFASEDEFARLHAAIRLVLPIIPALAASSPIAECRSTGCLDYRMEVYRNHPLRVPSIIARVIPDTVADSEQYRDEILAPMYRDLAPLDPEGVLRHEWLNQRGAIARFDRNAIEIRVMDAQECPQADIAIVAATVGAIRALYQGAMVSTEAQQRFPTEALVGIMLATIREGEQAVIEDPSYLRLFGYPEPRCQAGDLWRHVIDALRRDAPQSARHWEESWRLLLEQGPLARRILRALDGDCRRERLRSVYRELCDCLSQGRMFVAAA